MADTATQKALFEAIHDEYYEATTDKYAQAYKDEFGFDWMFEQLGDAQSLIELASGVGTGAAAMKERRPSLAIEGCDISESAARDFTAIHGTPCHVWDLTKPIEPCRTYDAVLVLGGIHHLVADLPTAFSNIRNLLNPYGVLIMGEPNADYFLEGARQLWYRLDKSHFDPSNEHALSHDRLHAEFGEGFSVRAVRYVGGPAYFLLLQNWVLRIPTRTKKWVAPALMAIERGYNLLPGRLPFASFMAAWHKT